MIFCDSCLIQLSTARIPLAADGSRYRLPQPDIIQRESKLEVSISSLPLEPGSPVEEGKERLKESEEMEDIRID